MDDEPIDLAERIGLRDAGRYLEKSGHYPSPGDIDDHGSVAWNRLGHPPRVGRRAWRVRDMRRIALLSISIAVLTCSGCATVGRPEAAGPQETRAEPVPRSSPLEPSRVLHAVSDWLER